MKVLILIAKRLLKPHILLFLVLIIFSTLVFSRCLVYEPRIWMDEGIYLQLVKNIATQGHYGLQTAPGEFAPTNVITVGPSVLFVLAIFMKIFGVTVLGARIGMVFFGILFLIMAYKFMASSVGQKAALAGLVLVVLFNPLYTTGKMVSGEVPAMFFAAIALYYIAKLKDERYRNIHYFLASLFLGLAVISKTIFVLIIIACFLAVLFYRKSLSFNYKTIFYASLGLLIPGLTWVILQIGHTPQDIVQSFVHNINVYGDKEKTSRIIAHNIKLFFKLDNPLYFFLLLCIATVASIVANRMRRLEAAGLIVVLYGWLALINFLRLDPWYRYFFPAQVLIILFLPAYLWWIRDYLLARHPRSKGIGSCMVVVVLVGIGALHATMLYKKQVGACAPEATEVVQGSVQGAAKLSNKIYFLDTPDPAFFMPHNRYHQYINLTKVFDIGVNSLQEIQDGKAEYVFIRKEFLEKDRQYLGCYILKQDIGNFYIFKNANTCSTML